VKVAHGILGWDADERRSNRYGAVFVDDEDFDRTARVKSHMDVDALRGLQGQRVHVTCVVVEARKSGHVGDQFLKLVPSKPAVGETIDLGVGILELQPVEWRRTPSLVLRPGLDVRREELWIDPRKLYRVHDQTVDIFVVATDADFTPAPVIACAAPGVLDNGEGSMQVKKVGRSGSVTLLADVERVPEGILVSHPFARSTRGRRIRVKPDSD
jgi:hypothetical protein